MGKAIASLPGARASRPLLKSANLGAPAARRLMLLIHGPAREVEIEAGEPPALPGPKIEAELLPSASVRTDIFRISVLRSPRKLFCFPI